MFKKYCLILLIISIVLILRPVNNMAFAADMTFAGLARKAVESYFQHKTMDFKSVKLKDSYQGKVIGVFVTVIGQENKSRGCWGMLYPQQELKKTVAFAAVDAVKKDYRAKPISKHELPAVKFQVSLISGIEPVSSVREINPFRDGLMVQSGGRNGIILPGEAVDSHYQMVQAKLKAGIQPDEPCRYFKLVTKTFKE